jgi:hypothetical protein
MTTTTSRRAILAGIASAAPLTALSAVIPISAHAATVEIPSAVVSTPPEMLLLGEQLKPVFTEMQRLEPLHHTAYEIAVAAAGYWELLGERTAAQQAAADARFEKAARKSGYNKLCRQLNLVDRKARRIAKRVLKIETRDPRGYGIQAAATLVLDESLPYEADLHLRGNLLRGLVSLSHAKRGAACGTSK